MQLDGLLGVLQERLVEPARSRDGPFLFAIDHCFPIKGQGTVITGTVLSGEIQVNQVRTPCWQRAPTIESNGTLTRTLAVDDRVPGLEGIQEGQVDADVPRAGELDLAGRSCRHLRDAVRFQAARAWHRVHA